MSNKRLGAVAASVLLGSVLGFVAPLSAYGNDAGLTAHGLGGAFAVPFGGCGNGVLDAGEVCDDGNVVSGDCCASDCSSGEGDADTDGICDSTDNCPNFANADQFPVLFGQTVLAANRFDFVWADSVDWKMVTGTFFLSADFAGYPVDFTVRATGTLYIDEVPINDGEGFWYLFAPDCPVGSFASGGLGEADRDGPLGASEFSGAGARPPRR